MFISIPAGSGKFEVKPSVVATIIVLMGFLIRIWHLDYDQGMNSHPDERSNGYYAHAIEWPSDIRGILNGPRSTLNPFWDVHQQEGKRFTYGHFPLYAGVVFSEFGSKSWKILKALGISEKWVEDLSRGRTDPSRGLLMARFSIVLLDTLTVAFVYLSARKIYGQRTGLLSSLLYALAMLPVKDSHFFTFDPASATFAMMTILGSLSLTKERRKWYAYVIAGSGAGLAIASKFSSLPILAVPMVALAIQSGGGLTPAAGRRVIQTVGSLASQSLVVYVTAFTAFVIASPFILVDWDWFWNEAVVPQGNMVRGEYDWVFTRQYRGTWPYLYFVRQLFQWGLWYPLGISSTIGLIWTIVRLPSRFLSNPNRFFPRVLPGELLLFVWFFIYFGITGAFLAKFSRYMLPLLPMIVIFGAAWLAWLCGWWGRNKSVSNAQVNWKSLNSKLLKGISRGALIVCVVGGCSFWVSSYINGIWEQKHTWLIASYWIYEHVPDGSSILWEAWDDPLPVAATRLSHDPFPGSEKEFNMILWGPFDEDTRFKLDELKERLANADYVIYSSNRVYDSVRQLPERYPMTIAYYDAMFDGRLGFEVAFESRRQMKFLGVGFDEKGADESWTLYDHPKVFVMRKYRKVSDAEIEALLAPRMETAQIGFITPGSFFNPTVDWLENSIKRFKD